MSEHSPIDNNYKIKIVNIYEMIMFLNGKKEKNIEIFNYIKPFLSSNEQKLQFKSIWEARYINERISYKKLYLLELVDEIFAYERDLNENFISILLKDCIMLSLNDLYNSLTTCKYKQRMLDLLSKWGIDGVYSEEEISYFSIGFKYNLTDAKYYSLSDDVIKIDNDEIVEEYIKSYSLFKSIDQINEKALGDGCNSVFLKNLDEINLMINSEKEKLSKEVYALSMIDELINNIKSL